jgi:hypothetical protein
LTAKITVGRRVRRFNTQASHRLGGWIDAHLTFKEQHNQYMNEARAEEARLTTLTRTHGVVPESVGAVQVV